MPAHLFSGRLLEDVRGIDQVAGELSCRALRQLQAHVESWPADLVRCRCLRRVYRPIRVRGSDRRRERQCSLAEWTHPGIRSRVEFSNDMLERHQIVQAVPQLPTHLSDDRRQGRRAGHVDPDGQWSDAVSEQRLQFRARAQVSRGWRRQRRCCRCNDAATRRRRPRAPRRGWRRALRQLRAAARQCRDR